MRLPALPDEPDEPSRHRYCSLCGPKFNAPIEISRFVKRQGAVVVFGGARAVERMHGGESLPTIWISIESHITVVCRKANS